MRNAFLCRSLSVGLLVSIALIVTACDPSFYLPESELMAYHANLRTEHSANQLLEGLEDQRIEIEFDTSGVAGLDLEIRQSNLLEVLRNIPELWYLEQFAGQIRLERLSEQLEDYFQKWLEDEFRIVNLQGDSRGGLQGLERAMVQVQSARVFYRPDVQAIIFSIRVRLEISGTLDVRDPEGFFPFWISHFVPDGQYPLTVAMDPFTLRGQVKLVMPSAATAGLDIEVTPQPGYVRVLGQIPDGIANPIRQVLGELLSGRIDQHLPLRFDRFAVSDAHLSGESELELAYRSRPETARPVLDMVVRGEGRKIYHARKRQDVWTAFAEVSLSGDAGVDAVLVSSGPDQLELVTVSEDGWVLHAAWRDGAWRDQFSSRSVGALTYNPGKPALVATARGQLEVFAAAGDQLWHLRRLNGVWLPEQSIPEASASAAYPHHDPIAVQSGNQVLLLYVDGNDELYGIIFDLERSRWGEAFRIEQQPLESVPTAVACGDGTIDVVYVGPDQAVYHKVLKLHPDVSAGLATMSTATLIGGNLSGTPELACVGYRQLELVGRGLDGRAWHSSYKELTFFQGKEWMFMPDDRQLGAGWQGWRQVGGPFFGTEFYGARVQNSLAMASTHAGEVHLAVRGGRGSGPRYVFHNSYDSTRWGRSPWKTVHWRGYQRPSEQRFVGTPSVVASDRYVHLAVVGNSQNIWHGGLADNNQVRFESIPDTVVAQPVDPVVRLSGNGVVDVLYMDARGGLRHVRQLDGRSWTPSAALGVPAPHDVVSAPAVVSHESGQIEVVAMTQQGALFHWRYVNGVWEPPGQIATTVSVISALALVHAGAGQLELFAVADDLQLYRWRRINGQWASEEKIRTGFAVKPLAFGPTAVSSGGNGTVHLAVVEEETGRVFYRSIAAGQATETPFLGGGGFVDLGGNTNDVPVLATMIPTRPTVLIRDPNGQIYDNRTAVQTGWRSRFRWVFGEPEPQWGGFEPISSVNFALLGGIARLGDRELVAVAVDENDRIYVNRLFGYSWRGFVPVRGQTSQTQSPQLFKPALSSE